MVHCHLDRAVQQPLVPVPVWHFRIKKPEEVRTVVVVLQVDEFVDQHMVYACSGCCHQLRVQDDLSAGRAASPLPGHFNEAKRRCGFDP